MQQGKKVVINAKLAYYYRKSIGSFTAGKYEDCAMDLAILEKLWAQAVATLVAEAGHKPESERIHRPNCTKSKDFPGCLHSGDILQRE